MNFAIPKSSLDPHYKLAAYNLASALIFSGKKEEAEIVLLPFMKKEPFKVYLAILQDLELAPLLESPSILALRSDLPGKAVLPVRNPEANWVAHSAKHELLAAFDAHTGLSIFSLRTGLQVLSIDLESVHFSYSCGDQDCYKDVAAERIRAARAADAVFKQATTDGKPLPILPRF